MWVTHSWNTKPKIPTKKQLLEKHKTQIAAHGGPRVQNLSKTVKKYPLGGGGGAWVSRMFV